MFEPDEEGETGMRVKQPLASFLGKFRQARMVSQLLISAPGCLTFMWCFGTLIVISGWAEKTSSSGCRVECTLAV